MSETMGTTINDRAAEEFYKKGIEAEKAGLSAKATDFYERALVENPDHEKSCFNLAVLYDRAAEDAKAIELYERVCAGKPVPINALMNLAVLYEDNNHYDEAHRCLEAVLKTDPNHERARLYMKDVESARSMYYDDDGDHRVRRDQILEVQLGDFELSVRSRNCLKKMNLHTLGDLLRITEQELLQSKNFGETSLTEIKALLAQRGLRLGQAADPSAAAAIAPPEITPQEAAQNEVMQKSVDDLDLSIRSRKALQRLNINTVGDLISRTEEELLGCKNFGQTSLNEIKEQLSNAGLELRKLEA